MIQKDLGHIGSHNFGQSYTFNSQLSLTVTAEIDYLTFPVFICIYYHFRISVDTCGNHTLYPDKKICKNRMLYISF